MLKLYKIYTPSLLYQPLVRTFCQKEEEVVCFTISKVMLGPVQLFLIDSDAELFMYLIRCIKFGSWKVRRLNRDLRRTNIRDT